MMLEITGLSEYDRVCNGEPVEFNYDDLSVDFDDQDWLEYSLEFKYSNIDNVTTYAAMVGAVDFLGGL